MSGDGATSAIETARGTVERVEPTKAQRARGAQDRGVEGDRAPPLPGGGRPDGRGRRSSGSCTLRLRALREFPRLNGAYRDGAFETYSRVNVGVVLDTGEAPVVPTIFDADTKDPAEIAAELERLSARAANGELTSPELAGGTFTVASAAIGSVRSLAAVLNQGQAAALAVGAVTDRPLVESGDVVPGRALTATLSCDGRMVAAGEAARFLDRVRELLEDPG